MNSRFLLLTAGALLAASSVHAQLLSESFNYANGALETVSSGAWSIHSGTAALNIDGGKAIINQGDATSGLADLNRPFTGAVTYDPTTSSASIYYGLTVNFSTLPNAVGSYFAHLKSSTAANEFYGRLGANTEGAASGSFRLAISSEGWSAVTTTESPTDLSLDTDYRVVVRYDMSSDRATMWVNPVSESSTSVASTDAPTYAAGSVIGQFALRQGTSGTPAGFPGMLTVDDVLVGTTFAAVATPVPEPEEWAAIAGAGLIGFALWRRRR
jgi:hypothetical protein